VESTVIDATLERPIILRQGAISRQTLEAAIKYFDPAIEFRIIDKNSV
jgi:tRNA A37 threonylcarbamoyladenosine synthetase subunit TsaC/SUA5/YrdC